MKSGYDCISVYQRVVFELIKQGKKPAPAAVEMGLSKNGIANFKTSMPKADTLAVIADYLNVSVDYLLGRSQAVQAAAPVNPRLNKMISLFSQLTPEQQDGVITMLEGFTIPNVKTGTDRIIVSKGGKR